MIASRSFLFMCDHHIQNPESESRRIPTTLPTKPNQTVYIHPTALKNFIQNYLPLVTFPFILLSGDSDTTVPQDVREDAQQILQNPLLIKWYSQNCSEPKEKLCQLPIGLDFHTLARASCSWGPQQSLESQQQDIRRLKAFNAAKVSKCYANFQFLMNTRYAQDRYQAIKEVPSILVFYEPRKTTRMTCWKNMIQYKYVISPHGNGLDCHRTWEAIFLGCIPILKTSCLDPMFVGLPVLIVQNWSDVTQELLNTFVPDYSQIEKLELSYWKSQFNKNVVSK